MEALAATAKPSRARRRTGTGPGRRRSRKRYFAVPTQEIGLRELYGHLVSTTLAVRRDRFSVHVQRVVAHAKRSKRWTLARLLEEAKVHKSVYYRWKNGDWTEDLEPGPIERFHDAAGVPVAEAFAILWPGKYAQRAPTPPLPANPQLEMILRKLNDPNTSKEDLYLIQATFEMLFQKVAPEAITGTDQR